MNKHLVIGIVLGLAAGLMIGIGSVMFLVTKSYINPHEYQIRLETDSAYVYRNNVLVGVADYHKNTIDSIILKDNY